MRKSWPLLDCLATNFYLISAIITILLCTLWQVSLFMALYLCSSLVLCARITYRLHKNSNSFHIEKDEMNLSESHDVGRQYMS